MAGQQLNEATRQLKKVGVEKEIIDEILQLPPEEMIPAVVNLIEKRRKKLSNRQINRLEQEVRQTDIDSDAYNNLVERFGNIRKNRGMRTFNAAKKVGQAAGGVAQGATNKAQVLAQGLVGNDPILSTGIAGAFGAMRMAGGGISKLGGGAMNLLQERMAGKEDARAEGKKVRSTTPQQSSPTNTSEKSKLNSFSQEQIGGMESLLEEMRAMREAQGELKNNGEMQIRHLSMIEKRLAKTIEREKDQRKDDEDEEEERHEETIKSLKKINETTEESGISPLFMFSMFAKGLLDTIVSPLGVAIAGALATAGITALVTNIDELVKAIANYLPGFDGGDDEKRKMSEKEMRKTPEKVGDFVKKGQYEFPGDEDAARRELKATRTIEQHRNYLTNFMKPREGESQEEFQFRVDKKVAKRYGIDDPDRIAGLAKDRNQVNRMATTGKIDRQNVLFGKDQVSLGDDDLGFFKNQASVGEIQALLRGDGGEYKIQNRDKAKLQNILQGVVNTNRGQQQLAARHGLVDNESLSFGLGGEVKKDGEKLSAKQIDDERKRQKEIMGNTAYNKKLYEMLNIQIEEKSNGQTKENGRRNIQVIEGVNPGPTSKSGIDIQSNPPKGSVSTGNHTFHKAQQEDVN